MYYSDRWIERERDRRDLPEGSGEGIALFIHKRTSLWSDENCDPRTNAFLIMAQI